MEENKNCCEGKGCEKCGNCYGMHGHCVWKKCHLMKHFIWIVLTIVSFCLGTQLGELKSEARGQRFYRDGMMNWDYKTVKPLTDDSTLNTPSTVTPPVTQ
jgi:hypothetical protein